MFELGYSMGSASKRYAKGDGYDIMVESDLVSHRDMISDLLGRYVSNYPGEKAVRGAYRPIEDVITEELIKRVEEMFADDGFVKGQIWKVKGSKVSIICSYVPPQKGRDLQTANTEYGDLSEVCQAGMFMRGNLGCDVDYHHAKEATALKDLLERNLVIIGGPALNEFARRLMNTHNMPFEYKYDLPGRQDDYLVDRDPEKNTPLMGRENARLLEFRCPA